MRIGYGWVSTRDQNPGSQRDALVAAGCEEIPFDKASGKLARRPALDQALAINRAGDHLVVTKLDRLGRSLEHLIALAKDLQARKVDLVVLDQGIDTSTAVGRMLFQILGAIAEFEHALMPERTRDGLEAARAGPHGRPASQAHPTPGQDRPRHVRRNWPRRAPGPHCPADRRRVRRYPPDDLSPPAGAHGPACPEVATA